MGVLCDEQIMELGRLGHIKPFDDGAVKPGKISSGVTSYGYDMRIGYKFGLYTALHGGVIDPKNFDRKHLYDIDVTPLPNGGHIWVANEIVGGKEYCDLCGTAKAKYEFTANECSLAEHPTKYVDIPPNTVALGESIEEFIIPRDLLTICLGKSTYARCAVIVNVTPFEPEWRGKVTIELSNTAPLPARIYCGEGIAQVIFLKADQVCKRSYADKKGGYQNQTGLTLPVVKQ